jgi:hypothetical protein
MIRNQKSKIIVSCALVLFFAFCFLHSQAYAISPTASPSAEPSKTANPSATPTSEIENEKVKEIRDAVKEEVKKINERITKKAFTGEIEEMTDSTLTLINFRGKQRIRLTEETTIIGTSRKSIPAKDLALEDRIIAMGTLGENEILETKRVVVVPKPNTTPTKKLVASGKISKIDSKASTVTISTKDSELSIKIDSKSKITDYADPKKTVRFSSLKEEQKVIIIYPEPAEDKTPLAKTIFILP